MKKNPQWLKYKNIISNMPDLFRKFDDLEIILDEKAVEQFENKNDVTIGVVYESKYIRLIVDLVHSGNNMFTYERILPVNNGAVIAVPVQNNKFVLLEQFRHANREIQYSFPRGFGEKEIDTFENLKKELYEEIGAVPFKLEKLGAITSDSGLISNLIDVFYCEVESIKNRKNYEGIINIHLLSEEEVKLWIKNGRIVDSLTISAFELYSNIYGK